jgi:RimJ/RimL family protein N-acetyltransferase
MATDAHRNVLGQPVGAPLSGWTPARPPSRDPLRGRYCVLEALDRTRHAEDLHASTDRETSGALWTYLPYGPHADASACAAWIDTMAKNPDLLAMAIIDLATGTAVGVAAYLRMDTAIGSIEVGHLVYAPQLQRSTAATEAMYLMMDQAFRLGFRRYEWKCDALNAPSRRAAERLGFTYEGLFRQATIIKGRNRDTAWYSVIDAEWPRLRGIFQRWLDPANFDAQGQQRSALSQLHGDPGRNAR